ncbi:MAG: twin-arginine translocase TatA/TatE family subunit [Bacteroidia bacterium]
MQHGVYLEFMNFSGGEIFVILIIILLLFGGRKVPELMKGLGKGIKEFKDASNGIDNDAPKKDLEKKD